MKKTLAGLVAILVGLSTASGITQADQPPPVAPILGGVTRGFDPPDQVWLPGHRGVDLAGYEGQEVLAAMDGMVHFAGMVATRPVISLRHGDLSTTYEPVEATVAAGEWVAAGQVIGHLIAGHPCPVSACLHWGLKQGETYLDPLSLVERAPTRLISRIDFEEVRTRAALLAAVGLDGRVSAAGLMNPTAGVVTDAYGMRIHPLSGQWRFHDGLDIGAACGTALVAVADGVVIESRFDPSFGYRLVIDHGSVHGHHLTTAYNHALDYGVHVGQRVRQGDLIGRMGSTGDSTGCHLHFQTWVDGNSTDPGLLLP